MDGYSERVLIVPGDGGGKASKRVLAETAVAVSGTPAAGYAPVVQADGSIVWAAVEGGAASPAIVDVDALPSPGLTTVFYRLTDAATPANNGIYARTATAGQYVRLPDVIDALDSTSAVAALSANQGRVLAGMIAAAGGGAPVGAVEYFAMQTPPAGWLFCNGALISRTTYATLFAAIGTTYGAGDGSTTFALPDLRGEFVRGWDGGRGVDSGRAFGSAQAYELKSHTHSALVAGAGGAGTTGGSFAPGNGTTTWQHGVTVGSTGGTETRPRNIALLACIKY